MSIFLGAIALYIGGAVHAQSTYHVSQSGDDSKNGQTPATAWRTVSRVNSHVFAPGDQILFERGGEWRECLVPKTGGTANQPVVFAAYGQGSKPRFLGSNTLDTGRFEAAPGGIFRMALTGPVHAVLIDHQFLRSSSTVSKSADMAVNLDYLKSHPRSWYLSQGILYISTGGIDPRKDGRKYTAVSRDDLVFVNGKDHLIFRDLVVDESARSDAGYGFRIFASTDVRLERCEAYRCGKHHFGVINSTRFVGVDLHAAHAMPDQGMGGASAYVSYSDHSRKGDTSYYLRCSCNHMDDAGEPGRYPAFVTHGEGLGSIVLEAMTSQGADIALGNQESQATIKIKRGRLEDAVLAIYGERIVVDGLAISGKRAGVMLDGSANVLQNMLITGLNPGFAGYQAAITEGGKDNIIRFCTIVMDPAAPSFNAALSLKRANSGLTWYGNIMLSTGTAVRTWFSGFEPKNYNASYNFYSSAARFDTRNGNTGTVHTLDQWQTLGLDSGTRSGDPKFTAPAKSDYSIQPGSRAIDAVNLNPGMLRHIPTDRLGNPRLQASAFDMGAYESSGNRSGLP